MAIDRDEHWQLQVDQTEHWQHLLGRLPEQPPLRGVVHLLCLDGATTEMTSDRQKIRRYAGILPLYFAPRPISEMWAPATRVRDSNVGI